MPEAIHVIAAAEEAAWTRWLEPVPHDFYHTAAYHRFSEQRGEGEAFLAVYSTTDRYLAWPYLLRRVEPARSEDTVLRDVTSVYGYAGPLAYGCPAGDPFLTRACARIAEVWTCQNAVSAFTRFHPLLENQRWTDDAAQRATAGGVRCDGETVSMDLGQDETGAWHDYQPSLRNRINRGRRLGLVTEADESWTHLPDFVRFYHATMARNHAAPWYFFPLDYFRGLQQALAPHAFLMLTRLGSEIAAAAVIIEYNGIVQNHFCMNNEKYLALAPSKVLLDDVRLWARARGNQVFHLGGGRGGSTDSLFAFKAAFSRRRHRFYTGRWILAPHLYCLLCESAPRPAGDFFPAYRAPREPADSRATAATRT